MQKKLKALLAFIVLALAVLAAQTTLPITQLRGGAPGAPRLYVVLPNGKLFQASFGTGFTLDSSGSNWILNFTAAAPPSSVEITGILLKGTFAGNRTSYKLPETPLAGSLKVFVNGIRVLPVADYDFSNNTITLNEGYGDTSSVDNNVAIDYRK